MELTNLQSYIQKIAPSTLFKNFDLGVPKQLLIDFQTFEV